MIPKIIHYCWFGGSELPPYVEKCIETWKKYCPDYQIRRWDESNFDVNMLDYTREAYNAGKYAFVSDVARLYAIKNEGGFYLDTDVELIKSLDSLRNYDAYMGIESGNDNVSTGLGFGAIPNHPVIAKNLAAYQHRKFIKNSKMDLTTCVTITKKTLRDILPSLVVKKEPVTYNVDNTTFTILPQEVLCPYDLKTNKLNITPNTITIHHYKASWKDKPDRFLRLKMIMRQMIGDDIYDKIKSLIP